MRRRAARVEQLTFERLLGGRRKGAGRKKSPDSGVSHLKRAEVSGKVPLHVTVRVKEGLPSLRTREAGEVILNAFGEGKERAGRSASGWFHLCQYSIQGNHIHMLVEGADRASISRGMAGILVRISRGLNKLWGGSGKVFPDRYHDRVLRTPREVYGVLRYIFENARRHGARPLMKGRPDPFSSGLWFDGWKNYVHDGLLCREGPLARATSWLLSKGWRRHGLLDVRPAWDRSLNRG